MIESHRSSSAERGEDGRSRSALRYALERLARRAHSEGELTRKMQRAGFPDSEIARALEELRARRYVDDAQFAQDRARWWVDHKYWGPARVAKGLRDRGVDDAHIGRALAEIFAAGEDGHAKRALTRYRRVSRNRLSGQAARARAYRHLLARGFSPAAILSALDGQAHEEKSGSRKSP